MNVKDMVTGFSIVAPIVLVVSLIVAYLYGWLAHGSGLLDWELSIRLTIIMGIVLPIIHQLDKKKGL